MDNGIEYFGAEDTRPLAIVNTDNRLIANAYRLRLEPIVERVISKKQQRFPPGRSMISNVLDIEHSMACNSWTGEDPCAGCFDFKAAFPTLAAHRFLHKALKDGHPVTHSEVHTCAIQ